MTYDERAMLFARVVDWVLIFVMGAFISALAGFAIWMVLR